ncbi:ABC transporter ATP-binding protein [Microbacterium aurugineum]|uniref:ABC transporter ATP-binding protein n=1 Tax=Microbacterium aurugineum TaxID=2851642 RepID=UPI0020C05A83|nr:ABC transporter ATP-binding protein [Microbacterium aurugineum]MCK8475716.1 ABC transporter ATP-binding protein [Microbacterium aurugineum]
MTDHRDGLDARRIRFGRDDRLILDGMHLTAPGGAVTALLGPNGSGKSTLLRLIAGTLRGEVESACLHGDSLLTLKRRERAQRVALVEQEWSAAEGMTGRDIVGLGLLPHRGWLSFESEATDAAATETALRRAGALAFADRDAATLSGGERQRVNLARALAQRPALLLCDEPTNHLDIRAQLDALTLLRSLAGDGMTVFAALHDLNHAAAFADRIVVVANGHVQAAGSPQEVLTRELIARVWNVDAVVLSRPDSDRPLIVFDEAPVPVLGR